MIDMVLDLSEKYGTKEVREALETRGFYD